MRMGVHDLFSVRLFEKRSFFRDQLTNFYNAMKGVSGWQKIRGCSTARKVRDVYFGVHNPMVKDFTWKVPEMVGYWSTWFLIGIAL